jgi:hypothetical protein
MCCKILQHGAHGSTSPPNLHGVIMVSMLINSIVKGPAGSLIVQGFNPPIDTINAKAF